MDAMCSLILSPLSVNAFSFFIFAVVVFLLRHCGASEENDQYKECSRRFVCGGIDVTYPYWGQDRPRYCGLEGFGLLCEGSNSTFMEFENQRYRIFRIDQETQTIALARDDLFLSSPCRQDQFQNTTINNHKLLDYPGEGVANLTIFYGCAPSTRLSGEFPIFEFPCQYPDDPAAVAFSMDDVFLEKALPGLSSCRTSITIR